MTNRKGADQTVWMHWLVCTFNIGMQQNQVFSYQHPSNVWFRDLTLELLRQMTGLEIQTIIQGDQTIELFRQMTDLEIPTK